jgi:hypothetical protein
MLLLLLKCSIQHLCIEQEDQISLICNGGQEMDSHKM